MKLVEVIAGLNTPAEMVEKIKKTISEEIGKVPVTREKCRICCKQNINSYDKRSCWNLC